MPSPARFMVDSGFFGGRCLVNEDSCTTIETIVTFALLGALRRVSE